jgi:hypothetical protein
VKRELSELNFQVDMKAKIIEIAAMLLNDNCYSRKDASKDLLLVARELSENETAVLRKMATEIKNKKSSIA